MDWMYRRMIWTSRRFLFVKALIVHTHLHVVALLDITVDTRYFAWVLGLGWLVFILLVLGLAFVHRSHLHTR